MSRWVDSHCHLDSVEEADQAVDRALQAGVEAMITVGTDLESSRTSIDLSGRLRGVWASVGVHPHEAKTFTSDSLEELRILARNPHVVAIGETGLDYFRDLSPRPDQADAFRAQIDLAKELGLVLVVHNRDAHDDLFGILEEQAPLPQVVFHCFSGGIDEARRALDLGGHLSFAGNLSYPRSDDLRAAAAFTPLERLLVETDSPYLTPTPHRGKRNEPALVARVGEVLAEVRRMPSGQVAEATTANSMLVFGLGNRRS
jgi:TatD DNase family protein